VRQKRGIEAGGHRIDPPRRLTGIVVDQRAAMGIGVAIGGEGLRRIAGIFPRLAAGKFEVEAVLGRQILALQRLSHRGAIRIVEAHRLQVRQRPPRLAKAGLQRHGLAIGLHRIAKPPHGFQHMAAGHPHPRMPGKRASISS
jgi:hypothetical protein